jgi:hypothetical protein
MSYGKTLRFRVLGLRGKHQARFYLKDRRKIIHWTINALMGL